MEGGFGARLIDVAGFQISETILVTWIAMAVLIALAIAARIALRKFETIPKGVQNVIELLVESINNLTMSTMGEHNRGFAPFVGTMFIFIIVLNIIGLFGLKPPTSDVNTTLGFGVLTFLAIQVSSVRKNGLVGHVKGYFEPMAVLFPVNVIGDLATPISLGFRLFGNTSESYNRFPLYGALGALSSKIGLSIPIFQAVVLFLLMYILIYFRVFCVLIFVMLTMIFMVMAIE